MPENAFGCCFRRAGSAQKVFDPDQLFAGLDRVLTDLEKLPLKQIIVMSPFSVPDPIIRPCRRRAATVFSLAAQRHGCVYIDTFRLLEAGGGKGLRRIYCNRFHLNRSGHEKVGRLVAGALRAAMAKGGAATATASRMPEAVVPVMGLAKGPAHQKSIGLLTEVRSPIP